MKSLTIELNPQLDNDILPLINSSDGFVPARRRHHYRRHPLRLQSTSIYVVVGGFRELLSPQRVEESVSFMTEVKLNVLSVIPFPSSHWGDRGHTIEFLSHTYTHKHTHD